MVNSRFLDPINISSVVLYLAPIIRRLVQSTLRVLVMRTWPPEPRPHRAFAVIFYFADALFAMPASPHIYAIRLPMQLSTTDC
jgi:hypothetical protein